MNQSYPHESETNSPSSAAPSSVRTRARGVATRSQLVDWAELINTKVLAGSLLRETQRKQIAAALAARRSPHGQKPAPQQLAKPAARPALQPAAISRPCTQLPSGARARGRRSCSATCSPGGQPTGERSGGDQSRRRSSWRGNP